MGDANFSLENHIAAGDRKLTRANAVGVDVNRAHITKSLPETKALHDNVLRAYDVDDLIDLHHQGTRSAVNGELVSGSILSSTNPAVDPAVPEASKRLGSVVYNAIEPTGWGLLGKYVGGTENTIGRNGIATEYGIATLLFEMRGMSDHANPSAVLGQKSNGYLIRQTVTTPESTARAIADRSSETADITFWDTLPEQRSLGWPAEEADTDE
jgi:murein tripeptide amidase MpaA